MRGEEVKKKDSNPGTSRWFYFINYGVLAVVSAMFIVLDGRGALAKENFVGFYLNFLFFSGRTVVIWIAIAASVGMLAILIISFVEHAFSSSEPAIFLRKIFSKAGLGFVIRGIKNFFLFACPALASYLVLSLALGAINTSGALRLKDGLILSWDAAITGTYPFIALGNIHYPAWIFSSVTWSFDALPMAVTIFAFYLSLKNIRLVREYSTAFSLALFIMLPVWFLFPALSPQDRYIDNVYKLPIPQEIQARLASFNPQKELTDFFLSMRDSKKNLNGVMPTTTMPSAHVAWGALLFIYALRDRKLLGWILFPIVALSTLGTIVLAQHYFVDMPTGILFGLAAAALAKFSLS
ncbi:MAG: phosphatase PAP2 family protein [Patescibacteria group bacterium]|nr:phosphatase PAP2 family protein [Patescibacteria group bacterium]MDE2015189.1 phosphatase PAP2 family protein [Patescibacteria group bacterium]MDE2226617.1 phosphatase PAP2 family protein [Patescibacteria group bacterium]